MLLFSKIIHQISRSRGTKKRQFWPQLSASRLQIQFESTKFQGHAGQKKTAILTPIERFQTANPVWIHQISRSRGSKNRQFWPQLSASRLQIQFEFTDGFEMMHKAWHSIEEVLYCFSRSSIKLQGHKGWKIDYLNPIWVILLGRSQLWNPSDLPCFIKISQKFVPNGSFNSVTALVQITLSHDICDIKNVWKRHYCWLG